MGANPTEAGNGDTGCQKTSDQNKNAYSITRNLWSIFSSSPLDHTAQNSCAFMICSAVKWRGRKRHRRSVLLNQDSPHLSEYEYSAEYQIFGRIFTAEFCHFRCYLEFLQERKIKIFVRIVWGNAKYSAKIPNNTREMPNISLMLNSAKYCRIRFRRIILPIIRQKQD